MQNKIKNKTIILGVCGGIAVYKAVDLASNLVKQNFDVHVVMTKNAQEFVSELTFRTISNNEVITNMFDKPSSWDVKHISLAQKGDLIVVAPATANIIGKVANGIADDFLSTVIMASKAPKLFVPAMNDNMYDNDILQENIIKLSNMGYKFLEPEEGKLACGTYGKGRFPKTNIITDSIDEIFNFKKDLMGKKVLVTAGPTRESLDPVRYLTNRSSGKMGYNFAQAAYLRGADVTVVSGPVELNLNDNIKLIKVTSAIEMHEKVMKVYKKFDIIAMFAAVADYRIDEISKNKIKKTDDDMSIKLSRNPDICFEVGKDKGNVFLIGACAETENVIKNAKNKLHKKNMDLIIANDVTKPGAGFQNDTNIVTIIDKNEEILELPIMSKFDVSNNILNKTLKELEGK